MKKIIYIMVKSKRICVNLIGTCSTCNLRRALAAQVTTGQSYWFVWQYRNALVSEPSIIKTVPITLPQPMRHMRLK